MCGYMPDVNDGMSHLVLRKLPNNFIIIAYDIDFIESLDNTMTSNIITMELVR